MFSLFLSKSSKPHIYMVMSFMEAGTNNSQRNRNIIFAFLFEFMCNSTGKKAIYAHTQIVYHIQYRIWRLPDVPVHFVARLRFLFIHSFVRWAIQITCHLLSTPSGTDCEREHTCEKWEEQQQPNECKENAILWIESVYVTLFIILIMRCTFVWHLLH